jgi:hypothetical protein
MFSHHDDRSNGSEGHPGTTWFDSPKILYATSGGGTNGKAGQGFNGNVHNTRGASKSEGDPVVALGPQQSRIAALDPGFEGDCGGRGQGLHGFTAESSTRGFGFGGGGGNHAPIQL